MLEKEIKILEVDRDLLIQTLLQDHGAQKVFEGEIHDVYYDFPHDTKEDKGKMQDNKRLFRIRKKGNEFIYTIKRKRKKIEKKHGVTGKDEHEMPVTDKDTFERVLLKYGMKKIREKKKYRISLSVEDGTQFDFDDYENIPSLLEIESEEPDLIRDWISKLGLDDKKQLLGGSKKLFKHYDIEYLYF